MKVRNVISKVKFNQVATAIIIFSFLCMSVSLSIDNVSAQSLQFNSVTGSGSLTGNSLRGSGSIGVTSLGIYFPTVSDRSFDSVIFTVQRLADWSGGQFRLSIQGSDSNYFRPSGLELAGFVYNYMDLGTGMSQVTFNMGTQVLPAGNYWIVITLVGSDIASDVGINFQGTQAAPTVTGDFVNKQVNPTNLQIIASGSWMSMTNTILFRISGTIGTAGNTPTPTPTATTPPTPTPTPPPVPSNAYAYVSATIPQAEWTASILTSSYPAYATQFYSQDWLNMLRASFYISRSTTNVVNAYIQGQLYEVNNDVVGDLIANSTNTISYNSLTTGDLTSYNFDFNTHLDLNGQYIIAVRLYNAGSGTVYLGDQETGSWGPTQKLRSNAELWYYNNNNNNWVKSVTTFQHNLFFSVYGVVESAPTPTPTPTPPPVTPTPTPSPAPDIIDDNRFTNNSQTISIATGSSTIITANSAVLQPFSTTTGQYLGSITVQVNRLGTIPINGEIVAGIATGTSSTGYTIAAVSSPVIFNTIPTGVNQLTFYFDGTYQLNGDYFIVIASNNNALSNFDDVPPCLQLVVQNFTSTTAPLLQYRGGQIITTNPQLELWYLIRGYSTQQPTPTPIPSVIPTLNPQDPVPNPVFTWSVDVSGLWQPLLAWDFLGFVLGCWTYSLGGSIFYLLALAVTVMFYIRFQNLNILIIIWFIIGFSYAALIPLAGPLGITFIVFGFAGLLYKVLAEPKV